MSRLEPFGPATRLRDRCVAPEEATACSDLICCRKPETLDPGIAIAFRGERSSLLRSVLSRSTSSRFDDDLEAVLPCVFRSRTCALRQSSTRFLLPGLCAKNPGGPRRCLSASSAGPKTVLAALAAEPSTARDSFAPSPVLNQLHRPTGTRCDLRRRRDTSRTALRRMWMKVRLEPVCTPSETGMRQADCPCSDRNGTCRTADQRSTLLSPRSVLLSRPGRTLSGRWRPPGRAT